MSLWLLAVVAILIVTGVCVVLWIKGLYLWLPDYLLQALRSKPTVSEGPVHVMVCVADHFEPRLYGASYVQEIERVDRWALQYPAIAARHRDADGIPPQHTYFYPVEEYRPEHLDKLAALCASRLGDVEIHLHHDDDTAEGLRKTLIEFKTILRNRHGLLHLNERTGEIEYAFIHGNWALDNCGPGGKWCGVNNEITVLRETGCYADLTFPSAPERSQTRTINSIYYATDDPRKPKSHDRGVPVEKGKSETGDLMMIQGPLALNWASRSCGLLPRIENGELTADNPPTPDRIDLQIRQAIHVQGRPDWIFLKLHTHGAEEKNADMLLNGGLENMWTHLETKYNDGSRYCLHYVTAREMYSIIQAARIGHSGNPNQFRNYRETEPSLRPLHAKATH